MLCDAVFVRFWLVRFRFCSRFLFFLFSFLFLFFLFVFANLFFLFCVLLYRTDLIPLLTADALLLAPLRIGRALLQQAFQTGRFFFRVLSVQGRLNSANRRYDMVVGAVAGQLA